MSGPPPPPPGPAPNPPPENRPSQQQSVVFNAGPRNVSGCLVFFILLVVVALAFGVCVAVSN
jgi:hypothetical protein